MSNAQPSFRDAFNASSLSNDMVAQSKGGNSLFVDILDINTLEKIASVLVVIPTCGDVSLGRYFTLNVRLGDCTNTKQLFASNQMDMYSDNLTRLLPVLHKHYNLTFYKNKYHCFKSLCLSQNRQLPWAIVEYILEFLYYL